MRFENNMKKMFAVLSNLIYYNKKMHGFKTEMPLRNRSRTKNYFYKNLTPLWELNCSSRSPDFEKISRQTLS